MSVTVCVFNNREADVGYDVADYFSQHEYIERFSNERRRAESLGALMALKNILPEGIDATLAREESGRPYFVNSTASLSLSHSAGLSVAAICETDRVGVDIELIDEKRSPDQLRRIAERYFCAEELESLSKTGAESFYALWTEKEAIAKKSGSGLSKILSQNEKKDAQIYRFKVECADRKYIMTVCTDKKRAVRLVSDSTVRIDAFNDKE